MHPTFSVILFTVLSGAGYGFVTLFVLANLFGLGGALGKGELIWSGIIGFLLITIGLLFSTGHLANPKNAWRSFSRFRSSWLSREAVFAVAFYPFAGIYLIGLWAVGMETTFWISLVALIVILLAQLTVFSTGMIYACLKTIPAWNTSLVPMIYILNGLALGAMFLTVVRGHAGAAVAVIAGMAVALALLAGIAKAVYFFWIGKPRGNSLRTATGLRGRQVRLLDVGHTAGTFLTDEFGYEVPKDRALLMRAGVLFLGYVFPLLMLLLVATGGSLFWAWVALLSGFAGMVGERWLFFAEARHVVNLYHGRQAV